MFFEKKEPLTKKILREKRSHLLEKEEETFATEDGKSPLENAIKLAEQGMEDETIAALHAAGKHISLKAQATILAQLYRKQGENHEYLAKFFKGKGDPDAKREKEEAKKSYSIAKRLEKEARGTIFSRFAPVRPYQNDRLKW